MHKRLYTFCTELLQVADKNYLSINYEEKKMIFNYKWSGYESQFQDGTVLADL